MSALHQQLSAAVRLAPVPLEEVSSPLTELAINGGTAGLDDAERASLLAAAGIVSSLQARRNVNNQKTQWLFNQLAKF